MIDSGWRKTQIAFIGAGLAVTAIPARAAPEPLHGWQCMATVAEFATTGSMQQDQIAQRGAWAPPLPVYAGPQETVRIAAANGVILTREPLAPRNGRVEVLLPDGRRGWVESAQLVPWHSVSKPDLRCHAALLENGRYGWFTG